MDAWITVLNVFILVFLAVMIFTTGIIISFYNDLSFQEILMIIWLFFTISIISTFGVISTNFDISITDLFLIK